MPQYLSSAHPVENEFHGQLLSQRWTKGDRISSWASKRSKRIKVRYRYIFIMSMWVWMFCLYPQYRTASFSFPIMRAIMQWITLSYSSSYPFSIKCYNFIVIWYFLTHNGFALFSPFQIIIIPFCSFFFQIIAFLVPWIFLSYIFSPTSSH